MLYVYIGCFAFGIFYSIISAIFGSHGIDHGGVHVDHSGHATDVPSPLNPLVIASAIATFGAVGIIGQIGFKMGELASAVFALSFAGIVGAAIFFGIVRFMYGSQSNTAYSEDDLVGIEAEVVTPVPVNGVGEVAYTINGIRCSIPARTENGEEILKGKLVRIKEVKNHTAIVMIKITINDICELENMDLEENNETRSKKNDRY